MNNDLFWTQTEKQLPAEGVPVRTKVEDLKGTRNESILKRQGRLWFLPNGSMYVYYTPTHWRPL